MNDIHSQLTLFDLEQQECGCMMYVRRIEHNETKPFILGVHYARRMPCITDAFGLFLNGELVGVVTYGIPASRNLCVGIAGEENADRVLELNRLVLLPKVEGMKNLASYLVAHSLKQLPNGTFVVSYADTAWTHVGYIYQATNFLYTGCTKERTDIGNGEHHSRHYKNGETHRQFRSAKHRYIYLVGDKRTKKKMLKQLRYKIIPRYPKGNETRYDINNPKPIKTRIEEGADNG